MVTIKDVAARAGVSTATVSRAMSGKGQVSEDTRLRVLAAVEELGFVPSAVARGLKTRRSHLIGLILPEINDPFFAEIAAEVEEIASDMTFQVIVGTSLGHVDREMAHINTMLSHHVDGIMLSAALDPRPSIERIERGGVPCVLIDDVPKGRQVDGVQVDNLQGMEMLTEHLLDLGHRRIGVVAGRVPSTPAVERIEGYRAAFRRRGLPVPEELIRPGLWTVDTAEARTTELLATHPDVTALISMSTLITVGTLRAARATGRRIPENLSVASFDDVALAAEISPFLTATRQPVQAMCRELCRMLLGRIDGTRTGPAERVIIPPTLHIRASTQRLQA